MLLQWCSLQSHGCKFEIINCGVAVSSVTICRLHSAKFQSSHALFHRVLADLQFALGKLQPAPAKLQPALAKLQSALAELRYSLHLPSCSLHLQPAPDKL